MLNIKSVFCSFPKTTSPLIISTSTFVLSADAKVSHGLSLIKGSGVGIILCVVFV